MSQITPFNPQIPDEEVQRLFRKLGDTRLPEQPIVPDAGWDYGKRHCIFSSTLLGLDVLRLYGLVGIN